jgi:hypothetical protein
VAITINGSGTITGVSTGGLPDGIVDADTLAANSVTTAKILDATIASGDLASGVVSDNTPSCHAWLSADQTGIATNVITKITFDVEAFDTDNAYDNTTNYRFTPGVAGYYFVYSCFRFDFAGNSGTNHMYIRKNGVSLKQFGKAQITGEGATNRETSTVLYLNTTDYVEIYARQGTGSNQTINGGTNNNWGSPVKPEPDTVSAQLFCMKVAGVS